MHWGICCDQGWFALIDDLCATLQFHCDTNNYPQVEFEQVKEKMAILTIYWEVAPDWDPREGWIQRPLKEQQAYLSGIVDTYCHLSTKVCEICGEPGVKSSRGGWWKILCLRHAEEKEYKQHAKTN